MSGVGQHPHAGKSLIAEFRAQGRRTHVQVPGAFLVKRYRGFINAIADVPCCDVLGP
ncbi:hypothetical protein D3C87_1734710 [compost metagenome]